VVEEETMVEPLAAALLEAEWLEADGQGGFASGTVSGIRTRRYHALLLAATTPPTGRVVLVNGLEVWLETPGGRFALSAQRYTPDVVHPDGARRIVEFRTEPWPSWIFCAEDGTEVSQEVVACHERGHVIVRWRLRRPPSVGPEGASPAGLGKGPPTPFGADLPDRVGKGAPTPFRPDLPDRVGKGAPTPFRPANGPDPVPTDQPVQLMVRPLLSGRDYHALHHENPGFDFGAESTGARVLWRPYPGVPAISAVSDGSYRHDPVWYRNFQYDAERERGLDFTEDLASPGVFTWTLNGSGATVMLSAGEASPDLDAAWLLDAEARRRRQFQTPLQRAADAYVVRRGAGKTIVAGYPWFTDWGRDTFISLRGFMGLPGGLELAREILLAWAPAVSEGMVPNRFPDAGEQPEYNAVDASLWYVIAAHELLEAAGAGGIALAATDRHLLQHATSQIVAGYRAGTRFGIRMDEDGLLAAGVPGVQLTWMDAKIGEEVVTPRIGKPVEVQALWLNALRIAAAIRPEYCDLYRHGLASFQLRFWNEAGGCLFDVVDADHVAGRNDPALRPNQILAVGGLPYQVLVEPYASRVVETVERRLLTPLGLRSLAPGERGYAPHYGGGVAERDAAYHQGTVWPWLIGPFVAAWLRVRGDTPEARRAADQRFLSPLREHLGVAGLGHISEIADAEPPHRPGGCPFQAWSLGEFVRASRLVEDRVVEDDARPAPQRVKAAV
jgi:predicted glycogen debranching enzyme